MPGRKENPFVYLSLNDYYKKAKAKGLTRNERLRLEVMDNLQFSPHSLWVWVLLDFHSATRVPGNSTQMHAKGALVLFENLTMDEWNGVSEKAIARHGRSHEAQQEAGCELLATRQDKIIVFQDPDVLAHPSIQRQLGPVVGKAWIEQEHEGNPARVARMRELLDSTTMLVLHDDLDDKPHPSWEHAAQTHDPSPVTH